MIDRRIACAVVAGLLAAQVLVPRAHAQFSSANAYPNKPIRFVVPFPPQGFSEVIGRVIAEKLSAAVQQPVVNDVRPGASGNIGAAIVAKAAPDGYTLLVNSFNFVANPGAMVLPFDPIKDFAPVSLVADGMPIIFVVNRSAPYKTLQDLLAAARAKPGALNFATAGRGTSSHLAIEMLKASAGIEVVQVPYKGTLLSFTALLGGDITASIAYLSSALPFLKSGQMRGLATTGTRRSPSVSDLPTMTELGFTDFTMTGFVGILAPAKTPRAIIEKLNRELAGVSRQKDFVDRLAVYDMQPVAITPEAFGNYMQKEIARWSKVLRDAGYKPE
ncbi:MAG: Bug family tripartite tricarboxylate transporter substrate binding protein [Betaproteobacteria bacterium]